MQKPVLGRKLETLMSLPSGQAATDVKPPDPVSPAGSSPGMRSLIRGNRGEGSFPPAQPGFGWRGIPHWYLFGADLVLIALALLITFTSPVPLDWKKEFFCVIAVIIGAGLAVAALSGGTSPRTNASANIFKQ